MLVHFHCSICMCYNCQNQFVNTKETCTHSAVCAALSILFCQYPCLELAFTMLFPLNLKFVICPALVMDSVIK